MYECYPASGSYTVEDPSFFLFAGTGAERGYTYPGLVGIEVDRAYPGRATPRPLQVVAKSPTTCRSARTVSTSVYYTVPSGAGVFSTGTMRWVRSLKGPVPSRGLDEEVTEFARRVTDNLLREMVEGPMGKRHPAVDNCKRWTCPRATARARPEHASRGPEAPAERCVGQGSGLVAARITLAARSGPRGAPGPER